MRRLPVARDAAVGAQRINLGPEVCSGVLALIKGGWEAAKLIPRVHPTCGEVCITEALREGMRGFGRKNFKNVIVLPGAESKSHPDLNAPDGRTDIPLIFLSVFSNQGQHDPHAIIECKRVSGADCVLSREYVVSGIDRFKTGQYGWNHTNGFMAGYVIAGDAATVVVGINAYLARVGRCGEDLDHLDGESFRSEHPRNFDLDIVIHHQMLEFDT